VEHGEPYDLELEFDRADGERIWVRTTAHPVVVDGAVVSVIGDIVDITDSKRAQEALRESEARYRSLFEDSPVAIWEEDDSAVKARLDELAASGIDDVIAHVLADREEYARCLALTRNVAVNKAAVRLYEAGDADELMARNDDLYRDEGDRGIWRLWQAMLTGERSGTYEETNYTLTGKRIEILETFTVVPGHEQTFDRVYLADVDITERKRAEQRARESELSYRIVADNTLAWEWWAAPDGRYLYVSPSCARISGHTAEEFLADPGLLLAITHPDDAPALKAHLDAVTSGSPDVEEPMEFRITTPSGEQRWIQHVCRDVVGADGAFLGRRGSHRDVTVQRTAQRQAEATAREWRRTFDAMSDSVALFDREGLVRRCNLATTALVGRDFEYIVGRPCYEVFHGMHDYHEHCPQLRAVRSGRSETSIMEQDGAWLRVTFEPEFDDAGTFRGGIHIVTDVTDLKQAEARVEDALERQKRTTEGVIGALSRVVAVRDPYTSGHEQRVSRLAVAVAQRLGADEDVLHCVRVAGLLHDIGKIVVPADILSKPGRLSEAEFALVREHARAATEILATVAFDCPVAEVVSQHHERLDGSGYPAGLSGEAIRLEARILAVADVAEAMLSHRPYRAALPLEEVLAEIEGGAGTRYDAAVCAAAVGVLRSEGFTLDE
jgi:PAS domain S-box-containing protein/putative nucleotidyltransferase with HDIG domain